MRALARLSLGRAGFAAVVVLLAIVPLTTPPFWVTLSNYIGLYSIVALGLVLLTGVAGQTSFGQAAFVGLGAYTTAYLTTRYGTSPWLTLPIGLFWDTSDPYRYVRIEAAADGYNVIAGGEDHKTGQVADTRQPQADLDAWCQRLLPSARITHRWSGQVLETSDGMPIIGEVAERQWMATGFGGNGITFGTLSAMLATNAISGRSHPWNDLLSARRIAALRSPWGYIRENVDYPYYLLKRFIGPDEDRTLRGVAPGEGAVIKLDGRAAAASRDEAGEDITGLAGAYDAMLKSLTAAQIQAAAKLYFNTKNYASFVLLPDIVQ